MWERYTTKKFLCNIATNFAELRHQIARLRYENASLRQRTTRLTEKTPDSEFHTMCVSLFVSLLGRMRVLEAQKEALWIQFRGF